MSNYEPPRAKGVNPEVSMWRISFGVRRFLFVTQPWWNRPRQTILVRCAKIRVGSGLACRPRLLFGFLIIDSPHSWTRRLFARSLRPELCRLRLRRIVAPQGVEDSREKDGELVQGLDKRPHFLTSLYLLRRTSEMQGPGSPGPALCRLAGERVKFVC